VTTGVINHAVIELDADQRLQLKDARRSYPDLGQLVASHKKTLQFALDR
jgi:hypothetical protein